MTFLEPPPQNAPKHYLHNKQAQKWQLLWMALLLQMMWCHSVPKVLEAKEGPFSQSNNGRLVQATYLLIYFLKCLSNITHFCEALCPYTCDLGLVPLL